PKPRLVARSGSSSWADSNGNPTAAAASTTARPSSSASQRARCGRPSGSATSASRQTPPSAASKASAVPSPPSAIGNSNAPAPPLRNPSASASAAAAALSTPLKLAGHASARRLVLLDGLRFVFLRGCDLSRRRRAAPVPVVTHRLEAGERETLAREEGE